MWNFGHVQYVFATNGHRYDEFDKIHQLPSGQKQAAQDADITANNLSYFGKPVYEYTLIQAQEDDYLAACEIVRLKPSVDWRIFTREEVIAAKPIDACTVDLLATGVDIERLNAVVFFRYLESPIAFYQMVGRGPRIHEETQKYKFWLYGYTGVTALFERFLAAAGEPATAQRLWQNLCGLG